MRKLLFLAVMLVSSLAALAEDGVTASLTVSSSNPGNETYDTATLHVSLTNPSLNYVAFQFDVQLPAGMDLEVTEVNKSDRLNESNFFVAYNILSGNVLRVLGYNLQNAPIGGESGEILSITMKDKNAESASQISEWSASLKAPDFVTETSLTETILPEISTNILGDVNKDGDVSVGDISAVINIIKGNREGYDLVAADANLDGDISVADISAIISIIKKM